MRLHMEMKGTMDQSTVYLHLMNKKYNNYEEFEGKRFRKVYQRELKFVLVY